MKLQERLAALSEWLRDFVRHPGKLKNKKYLPFLIVAALALFFVPVVSFRPRTSAERPKEYYSRYIPVTKSSVDKDGDGIDDQTDILENALAYTQKRPRYHSRYYEGGYPTDNSGVCTDLVAAALLGAGYDLRELVAQDREAFPEEYARVAPEGETPDPNIDYRRVRNLKIYLARHAISLTTQLEDIHAWQGGDIVVFADHIGILSNRRSIDGVPYVIHHESQYQKRYEQDILEARNDIVAHYRISR